MSELEARLAVEEAVRKYRFRPLPLRVRTFYLDKYRNALNGFDSTKPACIKGKRLCSEWDRVVIGDYGAYLEFRPETALVEFTITKGQEWRIDQEYIAKRGLNIKYVWLEYAGVKVYYQLGTVQYADYLVDRYYVSVLDLD